MIIPDNVTLVLGAGVSNSYGFPLGSELVGKIIQISPPGFVKKINQFMPGRYSIGEVEKFQADLRDSGRSSIDRFLQHQSDRSELGKALISFVLMNHEERDEIYTGNGSDGIYSYLYNDILNPTSPDTFNNKRIVIITYNYDRSLEFYLLNALRSGFGISEDTASDFLDALPIYHVHGSFGEITGPNARQYARCFDGLENVASRLSIVSEDIEQSGVLRDCWNQISLSNTVVFLGFGYDRANVERLRIPAIMAEREEREDGEAAVIYGTTKGLVNAEVEHRVQPLFRDLPTRFFDTDCLSCLRELSTLWV